MTEREYGLRVTHPGCRRTSTPTVYPSLVALMEESFTKYADRTAYSFMGATSAMPRRTALSRSFAAYLQGLGLVKGDRVAIMMPNCAAVPGGRGGDLARRPGGGEREPAVHAARA
jgi:acyl-CoA synthetase (AMP-forming)/AMP-acid ligase II